MASTIIPTLAGLLVGLTTNNYTVSYPIDVQAMSAETWTFTGPYYQNYEFIVENKAWCKHITGSLIEPCPWTSPFANLFNNQWQESSTYTIDLWFGTQTWFWEYRSSTVVERWTNSTTNQVFERELYSKIFEDKPRIQI